jgi:hypothetical protein
MDRCRDEKNFFQQDSNVIERTSGLKENGELVCADRVLHMLHIKVWEEGERVRPTSTQTPTRTRTRRQGLAAECSLTQE